MANRNTAGNRMIRINNGIVGPIEPRQRQIEIKTAGDYPGVPKAYLEVAQNYGPDLSGPPLCDKFVALIEAPCTKVQGASIRLFKRP